MKSTLEQIFKEMPHYHLIEPEPMRFIDSPICRAVEDSLSGQISTADGISTFSIQEFAKTFALQKWSPLLIAEGLSFQAFEKLVSDNKNYGAHFKYEHDFCKKPVFHC